MSKIKLIILFVVIMTVNCSSPCIYHTSLTNDEILWLLEAQRDLNEMRLLQQKGESETTKKFRRDVRSSLLQNRKSFDEMVDETVREIMKEWKEYKKCQKK